MGFEEIKQLRDYSIQNKKAWEFSAYDFWCQQCCPEERAKTALENPREQLKKYADYFDKFEGIKIANICGSCGKKAVPLSLLGADVTVFDISEDNKKYALEVAALANTQINYQTGDVLDVNMNIFGGTFDVVFMEGGVLHYFHNIDEFMSVMYSLLKPAGKMICSDFHPFTKIIDALKLQQKTVGYFSKDVFEGEMAHARFFEEEIRKRMPLCSYRKYTISEIINAAVNCGFNIRQFDEHPAWDNPNVPGEFTLIAKKA